MLGHMLRYLHYRYYIVNFHKSMFSGDNIFSNYLIQNYIFLDLRSLAKFIKQ